MTKFAVMIDVDGEWMYVPENTFGFPNHPEPKLFDSIEGARLEQDRWNTGIVVDYPAMEIRPMSDLERKRALERQAKNGHR
jgi:hypothetical protein